MRKFLKKLAFPLILFLILSGMSWLMIRNYETVNLLSYQGKNPVSIITPGVPGEDGDSAYDIAVKNGYKGSQQDWLATFKGQAGQNGLSAYQVAVQNGYNGSISDWLLSLVGENGKSAYQVALDNGFVGTQGDWLASLIGAKGDKGDSGTNGLDGAQGPQGMQGEKGDNGKSPVIACVSRQESTRINKYIAWKYDDDDTNTVYNQKTDTGWRLLYRVSNSSGECPLLSE